MVLLCAGHRVWLLENQANRSVHVSSMLITVNNVYGRYMLPGFPLWCHFGTRWVPEEDQWDVPVSVVLAQKKQLHGAKIRTMLQRVRERERVETNPDKTCLLCHILDTRSRQGGLHQRHGLLDYGLTEFIWDVTHNTGARAIRHIFIYKRMEKKVAFE